MRLTVHLKNAPKRYIEVKTKDGIKKIQKVFNTLSFKDVEENEVSGILADIEASKMGKPVDHYLSNEKLPGKSKGKKKT